MAKLAAASSQETSQAGSLRLVQLEVRGFRSARAVAFAPERICAHVGEAHAGNSNLLVAIREPLDRDAPANILLKYPPRGAAEGSP